MDIKKATWTTDGDNVSISMPLTKIDAENRIVSGFASLDNADTQGDIITKEANKKAFERFRGNIREMHQPIAVGRMISFKEDTFYDKKTEKFYNGIWVNVRVSKGAQNTWEKVLDGTLQGFSIGGSIIDAEPVFDKSTGSSNRVVKDYELVELSLVDSPANQLANVVSINKVSGEVSGMIADVATENIFWCDHDSCEVAKTSSDETMVCPNGHRMVNIGWMELDGGDRTQKVQEAINKYQHPEIAQEIPANNEGGVEVATENEKPEAGSPVPAEVGAGEEGKAQNEIDSSVESNAEAANVSEVQSAEDDLAKMFDDLKSDLDKGLEKNASAVREAIEAIDSKMNELSKSFEAKINEFDTKATELTEKFTALSESVDKMEKSIKTLDNETAVKKSASLGGDTEESTLSKSAGSKWNGHFLSVDSLD